MTELRHLGIILGGAEHAVRNAKPLDYRKDATTSCHCEAVGRGSPEGFVGYAGMLVGLDCRVGCASSQ